jgi:hypothetical protein
LRSAASSRTVGPRTAGRDRHPYDLYLALKDIDPTRTKTKRPQTNGVRGWFNKTLLDEFYRVAFRTRVCRALEEIQADLDGFVNDCNSQRPHRGRWC